jgi:hypothetical protein
MYGRNLRLRRLGPCVCYRKDHFLAVQETAVTQAGSPALTTRISARIAVGNGSIADADAENDSLLTECTHCNCGTRWCQLSAKSRCGCSFLVIPECGDLPYSLYLLNYQSKNESHTLLNQGNMGVTDD